MLCGFVVQLRYRDTAVSLRVSGVLEAYHATTNY